MPGIGVAVSPAMLSAFAFDVIATVVELGGAAWRGDEGKTGDPITTWDRYAGTAFDDWTAVNGAVDADTYLDFVPTDYYNIDGATSDYTELHRDGFIHFYVCRFDTDGGRTIVDNTVNGNASQHGVTVSKYTNGNNFYVCNGSGTALVGNFRGAGYPRTDTSPIAEWHLIEVGFHPEIGGWFRINGDIASHVELVGSPSSTNPTYKPRLGERAAATGVPHDGGISDIVWLPATAALEHASLRSLEAWLADNSPETITLDGADAVAGTGDPGLVLPPRVRIIQDIGYNLYKRGLSVVDGEDTRLAMSADGAANVYDVLGNAFRVYSDTVGTQTLTVSAGAYSNTTSLVTTAAPSTTPSAHRIVFLGDSRTAAGANSFVNRFEAYFSSGMTLAGTQGSAPTNHEGHSGRTIDWFRNDATSPLTSGANTLDISSYHTAIGGAPDTYVVHIGVNDRLTGVTSGGIAEEDWQSDAIAQHAKLQDIIDAEHAINSAANFIICFEPFGPGLDDIWVAGGYTSEQKVLYRRSVDVWNQELVTRWGASEGDNIYLAPTSLFLDPRHDWGGSDPTHYLNSRGHVKMYRMILAAAGVLL